MTTGLLAYLFLLLTIASAVLTVGGKASFKAFVRKHHCVPGYVTGLAVALHTYGLGA